MEEEIEEEVAKTISNDLKLLKMTLSMDTTSEQSTLLNPVKILPFSTNNASQV